MREINQTTRLSKRLKHSRRCDPSLLSPKGYPSFSHLRLLRHSRVPSQPIGQRDADAAISSPGQAPLDRAAAVMPPTSSWRCTCACLLRWGRRPEADRRKTTQPSHSGTLGAGPELAGSCRSASERRSRKTRQAVAKPRQLRRSTLPFPGGAVRWPLGDFGLGAQSSAAGLGQDRDGLS